MPTLPAERSRTINHLTLEGLQHRFDLVAEYRTALNLPTYAEKLLQTEKFLERRPRKVLVAGAGTTGTSVPEQAAKQSNGEDIFFVVAAEENTFGGMTLNAISAATHEDQVEKYTEQMLRRLYQPNVIFVPNWLVSEKDQDKIEAMGFSQIILADGATENLMPEWQYGSESHTWGSMDFVVQANNFLHEGRTDIGTFIDQEIKWLRDANGDLKSFMIQGGGKVGLWDMPVHAQWISVLDQIERSQQMELLTSQVDIHSFVQELSKGKTPLTDKLKQISEKYGLRNLGIQTLPKITHYYQGHPMLMNVLANEHNSATLIELKNHFKRKKILPASELVRLLELHEPYRLKMQNHLATLQTTNPLLELFFNQSLTQIVIDEQSEAGLLVSAIGFSTKKIDASSFPDIQQTGLGFRETAEGTVQINIGQVVEAAERNFRFTDSGSSNSQGYEEIIKLWQEVNGHQDRLRAFDPLAMYVLHTPLAVLERRLANLKAKKEKLVKAE